MKKIRLNFVTAFFCFVALVAADISITGNQSNTEAVPVSQNVLAASKNRQLINPMLMPFYAPAAYNQMLLGGINFGSAPYAFTPYSMYHMNPFMNPYFASQMPYALQNHPFGRQMLNYMTFMNPLMFSPLGFGNTWEMGDYGLGTPRTRDHPNMWQGNRKLTSKKISNEVPAIEPQPLKFKSKAENDKIGNGKE